MTIYRDLLITLFWGLCLMANGQQSFFQQTEEILLYDKTNEVIAEEHVYNQGRNLIVSKITNPALTPFIPSDGNKAKAAVIICPGGGQHGFGNTPPFEDWFNQCIHWMKAEQLHPLNR